MAKGNKIFTHDKLEKLMNTTDALSEIDKDESDSEGEVDELEADILYDGDNDVEYTPVSGEDSRDDSSGEEVSGRKRKKQKRRVVTPTPAKC